jgi:hypothetical protein
MAVGAVVIDRLMAVHERTAFLHMAGIARLINAIALHEFRSDRAMWIMAIGTSHFALGNRVMRRLVNERALLFVAVKTDIGLGTFVANIIVPAIVDYMT